MREREAIEQIWRVLEGVKASPAWEEAYTDCYGWLEEILVQTESRIQDDLEAMSKDMAL